MKPFIPLKPKTLMTKGDMVDSSVLALAALNLTFHSDTGATFSQIKESIESLGLDNQEAINYITSGILWNENYNFSEKKEFLRFYKPEISSTILNCIRDIAPTQKDHDEMLDMCSSLCHFGAWVSAASHNNIYAFQWLLERYRLTKKQRKHLMKTSLLNKSSDVFCFLWDGRNKTMWSRLAALHAPTMLKHVAENGSLRERVFKYKSSNTLHNASGVYTILKDFMRQPLPEAKLEEVWPYLDEKNKTQISKMKAYRNHPVTIRRRMRNIIHTPQVSTQKKM